MKVKFENYRPVKKKRIEYRVHFDDGDIHFIEGKNWRLWKCFVEQPDVRWIEKVEDVICDHYGVIDSEYETLWEREE